MFFLKHVLPLVIISVLIGYVVARVGFPPPDRGIGSTGETQVATASASPEPAPPSSEQDDILRRVREAVSERSDAETPDDQDHYTRDVNSEIEAAVEEWSAENLHDAADASQQSVEQKQDPADVIAAEPEATAETEIAATAEPPAPVSEETVETVDIVASESPTDTTGEKEEAATETVAIALLEPPAETPEAALAAEVAAELEDQTQAGAPITSSEMLLEEVLGSRWTLGNEPAAPHLPSFITSCKRKGEGIECWSGEYVADLNSNARTKTKSIIRNSDASGFTIRYRNMITDPDTRRSQWDQDVKQLNCTVQGQNRIRCENENTGQEIIYTRVTSEQFASRFTLSSLASTRWHSGGRPAEYLPSGTTRCESEAAELVCWTNARTVQSAKGQNSVKTKSLIRKTGDGTFSVTYRNLATNAGGQDIWEPGSHEAHCKVMGFERIVCEDDEGSRSFAKAVFGL